MEGQSLLQSTHCLYLINIPVKFHEGIPNDNRVMGYTRMKITQIKQNKNNQRTVTLKRNNGK